jgi:drug/metabolite transporter (DMT)-like permease
MHLSIILWGFTGIFGKLINLNEGLLVWYRLMITVPALFLLIFFRKQFKLLSFKEIKALSLVGFIIMGHWLFFYGAIKASNISITLSCFASIALFTSLIDAAFNRKRLNFEEIFFGLIAIGGIYLIFNFQRLHSLGIMLALISSALGALFTVMNKKMVGQHEPEIVTFYELGTGFIYLTLFMPIYLYFFPTVEKLPSSIDWFHLVLLSIFCTVIPFTLSLKALQKVSPFTMNLSVNLEPIYSIILAIIIFHENKFLNTGFFVGAGIILASVVGHGVYKTYRMKSEK